MIKLFQKSLKKEIADLSNEILDSFWTYSVEQSNIESQGIIDGKQIINEFLRNREYEIAYQHLAYIITECNIELNVHQNSRMDKVANRMNLAPVKFKPKVKV